MGTGSKCSACGADAVDAHGVCARCGYATGEENRCPHCGAVARAEARAGGGTKDWLCAVCGGPRIPRNLGGEAAIAPLKEAKAFLGSAARAKATSIAWGVLALLATLIVVAASAKEALLATLVLAVLAIVPAILALRARSRGQDAKRAADEAQGRAWLAAAEVAAKRTPSGVTAEELAKTLQIDAGRADKLLTELAVHERTRIDVGDDAEIRYSIEPGRRVGEPLEEPAAEAEAPKRNER